MKTITIIGGVVVIIALIAVISFFSNSWGLSGSSTYGSGTAKEGSLVGVDYWLTVDGKQIQTTEGRKLYNFRVGSEDTLEDFSKAVTGMKMGEEKEFIIPAGKGYTTGELANKELNFKVKLVKIYG